MRPGAHEEAALAIHAAIGEIPIEDAFVNVILGRWHGPSATFSWITCGHQAPLLISGAGELRQLAGARHPALGRGDCRSFQVEARRLEAGERLLLLSDGVLSRPTGRRRPFGLA